MSSSSGESGTSSKSESRKATPSYLASRILNKLKATPLDEAMPVADHQKATEAMMRMRDLLLSGVASDRSIAACLTCAGIAIHRRVLIGPEQLDAAAQLLTTRALLFVLVVLASGGNESHAAGEGEKVQSAEELAMLVAAWEASTLWDQLRSVEEDAASSSWARALREPGALCQTLLQMVRLRKTEPTLKDLSGWGALFFRASASAMAAALIDTSAPVLDGNDFLTLDVMTMVRETPSVREERLAGIADCAESESGQTVRSLYFEPLFSLRTHAYLPPGTQSDTTMSFHSSPSASSWLGSGAYRTRYHVPLRALAVWRFVDGLAIMLMALEPMPYFLEASVASVTIQSVVPTTWISYGLRVAYVQRSR
mgnify:CR=1 FL=1